MTQQGPEVSVVIPTYNRAQLLREALASVRAQTFTDWEAVVVNNHSVDDTVDTVLRFEDPRIRLVNFRNHGVIAASRNVGIGMARGPIVAFLDSDDRWHPTKLERCLQALTDEVDVVGHGLVYARNGRVWKTRMTGPARLATYAELLYTGNCLATSAVLVRKRCLERVSGFTEAPEHVGAEDYDLWIRLAKDGARFAFVDELLGEYRVHGENFSREALRCIAAQFAVIERHFAEVTAASAWERLRRRKRRALVFYTAGRGLQDDGKWVDALRMYGKGALTFPFIAKLYVAALLTVCGWPRPEPPEGARPAGQ